MSEPALGSPVRHEATKYDGSPHWVWPTVLAAVDELGHWLYAPAGTVGRRPGRVVTLPCAALTLVPYDAWFVATFNAVWDREDDHGTAVYVDIATPSSWPAPDRTTYVDLDLDVVRLRDDRVLLVDEDEFAEHRRSLGYPDDLVRAAEQSAARVHAAVAARTGPFDGRGEDLLRTVQRRPGLTPHQ